MSRSICRALDHRLARSGQAHRHGSPRASAQRTAEEKDRAAGEQRAALFESTAGGCRRGAHYPVNASSASFPIIPICNRSRQKRMFPSPHHAADDPAQHFAWLANVIKQQQPDLIVLARYMRILPAEIVAAYRHRIINIHPSLLPYFLPGAALRTTRRSRAACAYTAAPRTLSPSSSIKGRSFCRMSSTSTSEPTP